VARRVTKKGKVWKYLSAAAFWGGFSWFCYTGMKDYTVRHEAAWDARIEQCEDFAKGMVPMGLVALLYGGAEFLRRRKLQKNQTLFEKDISPEGADWFLEYPQAVIPPIAFAGAWAFYVGGGMTNPFQTEEAAQYVKLISNLHLLSVASVGMMFQDVIFGKYKAPKLCHLLEVFESHNETPQVPFPRIYKFRDKEYHLCAAVRSNDVGEISRHMLASAMTPENVFNIMEWTEGIVSRPLHYVREKTKWDEGLGGIIEKELQHLYYGDDLKELSRKALELDDSSEMMYLQSQFLHGSGSLAEASELRGRTIKKLFDDGLWIRIDIGDSRHEVYKAGIDDSFVVKVFDSLEEAEEYRRNDIRWEEEFASKGIEFERMEIYDVCRFGDRWCVGKDYEGSPTLEELLEGKNIGDQLTILEPMYGWLGKLHTSFEREYDIDALVQDARDKFTERIGVYFKSVRYGDDIKTNRMQHKLEKVYEQMHKCVGILNSDSKRTNFFLGYGLKLPDKESYAQTRLNAIECANLIVTGDISLVSSIPKLAEAYAREVGIDAAEFEQSLYCGVILRGVDMLGVYSRDTRDYWRRERIIEYCKEALFRSEIGLDKVGLMKEFNEMQTMLEVIFVTQ